MKFGSYAWVVNRSGGLISLLAGQKDYVRQQQSIMLSCGSNSVRLWSSTPWASSRQAVIPAWRCVAQQDGDDICTHDSPVGLKLDDVPEASFSVSVKSPQQMEETGAFFGKDSQEGDIALLWGLDSNSRTCDPMVRSSSGEAIVERRFALYRYSWEPSFPRDLGTGKTCFARGFIRARVGDPRLAVTSPSYLLDNTYEASVDDVTIHHMDLYRLRGGLDLHVLDIPSVLETCVCLVEWPDRLGRAMPLNRLDVHLAAVSEDERILTLTGHGDWWAGAVDEFRTDRETKEILP